MPFTVYALADSPTSPPRYIGVTGQSIDVRLTIKHGLRWRHVTIT